MQTVAPETLEQLARLLGASDSWDIAETQAVALVGDRALVRRVFDWLCEAFGLVLALHTESTIKPPTTFMAKNDAGDWVEIPLSADPVFGDSVTLASTYFHGGDRDIFGGLALRSSIFSAVNQALNQGVDIKGATIQPIQMHDLSAESYGEA